MHKKNCIIRKAAQKIKRTAFIAAAAVASCCDTTI
jgi:hypothetical protein